MKNMIRNLNKYLLLMCVLIFLSFGCQDNSSSDSGDTEVDNYNSITAFSFLAADNSELFVNVEGSIKGSSTTISLTVPSGTDVTALVPTISIIGSSVSPASDVTADFTNSVTYTVTAEDETTQDYTVAVRARVAGDISRYTVDSVSFDMVDVPGGLTFPTGLDDNDGDTTVTNAYLIGQTEVTYELWYAVRTWAEASSDALYAFANTGQQGDNGSRGIQHPVTNVNWRDAMVWTNALTEYYNAQNGTSLEPVYTYNGSIIRDSQDSNDTTCDNAVASLTASGFRLLTSDEWELAARYINDLDSNGTLDEGEYYPGSYASGAIGDYSNAASTESVAVYDTTSTAVVSSKIPNALGIYDMSGNVWEWAFEKNESLRMLRGGSRYNSSLSMRLGDVVSYIPYGEDNGSGFRFARTP